MISYDPSQSKVLLEELITNEDSLQPEILNCSIKLRYAFLSLVNENKLRFLEKMTVKADKAQPEIEMPEDYAVKLQDEKAIEAAKGAFICIVVSVIEHLKLEREKELAKPGTSFADVSVDRLTEELWRN